MIIERNKDEIILYSVRFITMLAQDITIHEIANRISFEDKIVGLVEGAYQWLEKYPKHGVMMTLIFYLGSKDERYRCLYNQIRKYGEDRIVGILNEAIHSKKIGLVRNVKIDKLARRIQDLITGTCIYVISCKPPEGIRAEFDNLVDTLTKFLRVSLERID